MAGNELTCDSNREGSMGTRPGNQLILIGLLLLAVTSTSGQAVLQSYDEGKIVLKKGFVIEGKKLKISMETVTMDIKGVEQTYPISEVNQIMAKQGKGKKYGKYCAGSCAGFLLASMLTNPTATRLGEDGQVEEYTPNAQERVTSLAMSTAISYGIGYLIGRLNDDWQIVYFDNG